jgi:ACT domain-containing protein
MTHALNDTIINIGQIFSRVKMIVNAELYVKDLPGHLVGSLEPISMVDGNIKGVVHDREQIVNNRISLNVTFEVEDSTRLKELEDIWKARDIIISSIDSVYKTYPMEYMLIGNLTASYIENLMDEAAKKVRVAAIDMRYSSKDHHDNRTAMISVKMREQEDIEVLDSFLRKACKEGNMTYIRGL